MPSIRIRRAAVATGLLASLIGTVASAGPLAADFSDAAYFLSGNFDNIGWSFSVNSTVTIDGLGLFDYGSDGLVNSHQVGVWDAGGNLLAQATVPNGGATALPSASPGGQWLFVDVAPVTLAVGNYVIGAYYTHDDADPVAAAASGLTMDSHFSYGASLASDSTSFGIPGAYGLLRPGIFGPDMRVALPEPGMLALLGAALVASTVARRRRG